MCAWTLRAAMSAAGVGMITVAAGAGMSERVVIDAFTDAFESEEFVVQLNRDFGSFIFSRAALEVGTLLLPSIKLDNTMLGIPTARAEETQFQGGLPGVFGGSRRGTLIAGSVGASETVVSAIAGNLTFNAGEDTPAALELEYRGGSGLNADFGALTGGAFVWSLGTEVEVAVPVSLTLVSGLGTAGEASVTAHELFPGGGARGSFAFADFAGIDFTDIDAITLRVDQGATGFAGALHFGGPLFAVPSPASAALALGGVALGTRRRRG